MEFTLLFLEIFFWSISLLAPLLFFLCLLIVFLGISVGRIENWNLFDSVYWAFITAATVGYGDIKPTKKNSKILSIVIALIGMIFTGILISISLNAASTPFERHVDPAKLESIKQRIG